MIPRAKSGCIYQVVTYPNLIIFVENYVDWIGPGLTWSRGQTEAEMPRNELCGNPQEATSIYIDNLLSPNNLTRSNPLSVTATVTIYSAQFHARLKTLSSSPTLRHRTPPCRGGPTLPLIAQSRIAPRSKISSNSRAIKLAPTAKRINVLSTRPECFKLLADICSRPTMGKLESRHLHLHSLLRHPPWYGDTYQQS